VKDRMKKTVDDEFRLNESGTKRVNVSCREDGNFVGILCYKAFGEDLFADWSMELYFPEAYLLFADTAMFTEALERCGLLLKEDKLKNFDVETQDLKAICPGMPAVDFRLKTPPKRKRKIEAELIEQSSGLTVPETPKIQRAMSRTQSRLVMNLEDVVEGAESNSSFDDLEMFGLPKYLAPLAENVKVEITFFHFEIDEKLDHRQFWSEEARAGCLRFLKIKDAKMVEKLETVEFEKRMMIQRIGLFALWMYFSEKREVIMAYDKKVVDLINLDSFHAIWKNPRFREGIPNLIDHVNEVFNTIEPREKLQKLSDWLFALTPLVMYNALRSYAQKITQADAFHANMIALAAECEPCLYTEDYVDK